MLMYPQRHDALLYKGQQPLNSLRPARRVPKAGSEAIWLSLQDRDTIFRLSVWKHLRCTCQYVRRVSPSPTVLLHTSQAAEARIQPLRHSFGLAFPLASYGAFQKQGQLFLITAVQPESYSHRGLPPSSLMLVFRSDLVKSLCP